MTLKPDVAVSPDLFFQKYRAQYGLGSRDEMIRYASGEDLSGYSFTRYRQHHRGIPVFGAKIVLIHRNNRVRFALGAAVPGLRLDTFSAIKTTDAIATVVSTLARNHGRTIEQLRIAPNPSCELGFVGVPGGVDCRLCYRVIVSAEIPVGRHRFDVDAMTGEVISIVPNRRYAWITKNASGPSLYDGVVTFLADQDSDTGNWRLTETTGHPVETRDAQASDALSSSIPITTSTGVFDAPTDGCLQGVSAHWAAEKTLAFFEKLGRHGIDGSGTVVVTNLVQFNTKLKAFFNFGSDGKPYLFFAGGPSSPVSLDTVAHEFTHGVAQYEVDFDYLFYESGALDESFADIFAAAVEFDVTPQGANWRIGEDWVSQNTQSSFAALRSLEDPKFGCTDDLQFTKCQPDTYLLGPWETPVSSPQTDEEVVAWSKAHTNSGVGNFWFYLLSEGGKGTNDKSSAYDVKGIGIQSATRIAYLNLTSMLSSQAGYIQAAAGSIQAAIQLFGEFSQQRISTQDAWHAVGVGSKYSEAVYYSPANKADKVEPWMAELKWQRGVDEWEWEVQVSTAADFSADVQAQQTGAVATENNVEVGVWDFALKPNTKYYWRVREITDDPKMLGWRPVNEFTTAEKRAHLKSPGARSRDAYHPWDLRFQWNRVKGAVSYRFEVAADSTVATDGTFTSSKILQKNKPHTPNTVDIVLTLDVWVDSTVWWHVQPVGPNGIVGAWSQPIQFDTRMPKAVIVAPQGNEPVHPWPVHFDWNKVKGADHYVVETTRTRSTYGPDSLLKDLGEIKDSSVDLNLKPAPNEEHDTIYWRVRVFGPPLQEGDTQGEQGDPSEEEVFQNAGDSTIPLLVKPGAPPDNYEILTGLAQEVEWKHVKGATNYLINVRGLIPLVAYEDLFVDADNHPTAEDLQKPTMTRSVPIFTEQHPHVAIYNFQVVAIGPEGIEGLKNNGQSVLKMPDQPALVAPWGTQSNPAANTDVNTSFLFNAYWSPSGTWLVVLYKGLNCGGVPAGLTWAAAEVPFSPPDTLEFEQEYSWRVRPVYSTPHEPKFGEYITNNYPWSACGAFITNPKPPPPAPVITEPEEGSIVSGSPVQFCWETILGVTDYEVTLISQVNSKTDVWAAESTPVQCLIIVNELDGTEAIPCGSYQVQVRAFNGKWGDLSIRNFIVENDVCVPV